MIHVLPLVLLSTTALARASPPVTLTTITVAPGSLSRCAESAASAPTRCILAPGVYRDTIYHTHSKGGLHPLEIVGSGASTVIDGTERLNVTWDVFKGNIYKASLPLALRIKGIQSVYAEGTWISEVRYCTVLYDNSCTTIAVRHPVMCTTVSYSQHHQHRVGLIVCAGNGGGG